MVCRIVASLILMALLQGVFAQSDFRVQSDPPTPLPAAVVGEFYKVTFYTTGGYAPFGPWELKYAPPDGMNFDPATGVLSGRGTVPGNYKWYVLKRCCNGLALSTMEPTIKVVGPLTLVTTGIPSAYAGGNYSFQFTATGGVPPYSWGIPLLSVPPFMTLDSATGVLSGTGSGNDDYTFTITVADSEHHQVSKTFTLHVGSKPAILFDYDNLKFNSAAAGPAQSQTVGVTASGSGPLTVTITPDTPKPDWIKVEPPSATTPVEVKVEVDPSKVSAGSHSTKVTIKDSSGQAPPVPIQVSMEVLSKPPALEFAPSDLRISAPADATVPVTAFLTVRNGGTGPLDVSATVTGKTPWLSVSPKNLTAPAGQGASFSVAANPALVETGSYSGTIHLASGGGNADVPVSFVKQDSGPRLETSFQGLQFDGRPGQAATAPQEIEIRNAGSGSLAWYASLIIDRGNFLVTPLSGTATPGAPSKITIQARPGALATGIHYSLLRVTALSPAQSPQDVVLVLNILPTSTPMPELSPEGLVFVFPPAPPLTASQDLKVYVDSSGAVDFRAAANTADGQGWLTVTPSSGQVSSDVPATLSVKVSTFAVREGIYTGTVTVGFSGVLMRTIPVTFIVAAGAPAPKTNSLFSGSASAAATRLVLTPTRPASRFTVSAGWPVPLSAIVLNQTGNPVADAQVSAAFSTGDPALPLRLSNPSTGLYTATWIPAQSGAVTVSLRAVQGSLPEETARITGNVNSNPDVPVIARNGILNNLNGVLGAPVAPGTVAAIYGSGLASQTVTQVPVPLPVTLAGTRVFIGGRDAPLYYVTPGQIAVQIPTELDAGSPQAVTVVRGDAVSVPAVLNLTPAYPGIAASADGRALAQHIDYTLITSAAPVRPGEWIILYLVGMGATDIPVASGQLAPLTTLVKAKIQPTVTIDGETAEVYFAGLTPGGIGLYQINCKVPESTRAGDLLVVVTQNGVSSNPVLVPVVK